MHESNNTDRATRLFQWAVVILLGLIAAALWDGRPSLLPQAAAQIPDTALQRKQMIDEQRVTNELLARILKHLETRPIKTRAMSADENRDDANKSDADRRPPVSVFRAPGN